MPEAHGKLRTQLNNSQLPRLDTEKAHILFSLPHCFLPALWLSFFIYLPMFLVQIGGETRTWTFWPVDYGFTIERDSQGIVGLISRSIFKYSSPRQTFFSFFFKQRCGNLLQVYTNSRLESFPKMGNPGQIFFKRLETLLIILPNDFASLSAFPPKSSEENSWTLVHLSSITYSWSMR